MLAERFRFKFAMVERIATPEDDRLPVMEVGSWAEDKYAMVALYDRLFSTAMKRKWDTLVYVDLYSGPGVVRIKTSNRQLWGSPMIALGVPDPFDKYILCESNPHYLRALNARVARFFPQASVELVAGDCNEHVDEICAAIPTPSNTNRVLSFCFLDPFDISIKFSTVRKLASFYIDFLFLLALHMDANRNVATYLRPDNRKIEEFLGLPDWRQRWHAAEASGRDFPQFLAEEYSKQMEALGYLPVPFFKMKQIRSDDRNLPLYRLALFSRNELAYKFWDEVLQYSTDQRRLEGL